ncbi:MAG: hypothetical protein AB1750_01435, partial [Chloroflexota bacterium]
KKLFLSWDVSFGLGLSAFGSRIRHPSCFSKSKIPNLFLKVYRNPFSALAEPNFRSIDKKTGF